MDGNTERRSGPVRTESTTGPSQNGAASDATPEPGDGTHETVTGFGSSPDSVYEQTRIGVVVPVFNEAPFIEDVLDSVPSFVDTVYVVDDRSTDGTWELVRDHSATHVVEPSAQTDARNPPYADGGAVLAPPEETGQRSPHQITAVRHAVNRGRGGAIKTGYRLALDDGMEVIAVMDGDGQMDGAILDRILAPVIEGDAAYAKGNRLVNSYYWEEMSQWRLFGNGVLSVLTKIASGYWSLRDPQNGYTAVTAEALEELPLEELFDDYGFLNDVLVRLGARGKKVADVPMRAVYDEEESGIAYSSFIPQLSTLLLRMYLWRLWVTYGAGEVETADSS